MAFYDNLSRHESNTAAIADNGVELSYSELERSSDEWFARINHRCLVFILCENSLGPVVGYVSCLRHQAVPLLLAKDLNPELLRGLIDLYRPEFLYLPAAMAECFRNCEKVHTALDYALLRTNFSTNYPLHAELALLLTTSGSTGSPKLVRQSYKNISSNAAAIAQYLELTQAERPITTLAMSYTYGLSIINSHLLAGATLLLTSKSLLEKGFWDFFREQKATSFGGVPYTYEILKKLRFFRMDLPSLRTMTQAGGKLTPELTREIAEFAAIRNIRFVVMYGQTEATARMAFLPHEKALEKCGSMGVPIPGGRFDLIDAGGRCIAESDVTGELVYYGPNVALGYAECGEDLAKGDEWGGVLMTGDMAMRDQDGFYYITGRKKRFLKIFGNRVNLDETERLVKAQFEGMDCACAGRDDQMSVFITNANMAKRVLDFLVDKTGLNPVAFVAYVVDRIPKNETGKILYAELEKLLER